MDKKRFKEECMRDIRLLVERMTVENLTDTEHQLSNYFQAIRAIDALPSLDTSEASIAEVKTNSNGQRGQLHRLQKDNQDRTKPSPVMQGRVADTGQDSDSASQEEGTPSVSPARLCMSTEDCPASAESADATVAPPLPQQNVSEEIADDTDTADEENDFAGVDFAGQTVLVVGLAPRKSVYKSRIESLGGKFLHAEGGEKEHRLLGLVQKSDVVVMIRSHVSHRASFAIVRLCKENDVKLVTTPSRGIKSVVQSAAIRLGIIEEEADNIVANCSVSRISNRMSG